MGVPWSTRCEILRMLCSCCSSSWPRSHSMWRSRSSRTAAFPAACPCAPSRRILLMALVMLCTSWLQSSSPCRGGGARGALRDCRNAGPAYASCCMKPPQSAGSGTFIGAACCMPPADSDGQRPGPAASPAGQPPPLHAGCSRPEPRLPWRAGGAWGLADGWFPDSAARAACRSEPRIASSWRSPSSREPSCAAMAVRGGARPSARSRVPV
mmetsp:Transcript_60876/g.164160  ORF Transcript_60876/g.164160 Transcript_60876/m.164160 type:complete len:211 (+) Transcript_60876:79-711(+)